MKINWYVQIPRWNGDAVHPRYWNVVSAEAGSEQDIVYQTGWTKNGSGEWVRTTAWYEPVESESDGYAYIEEAFRRWK